MHLGNLRENPSKSKIVLFVITFLLAFLFISSTTLLAKDPAANEYYANLDLPSFRSAQPIWPQGLELEMNLFVGFRTVIDKPKSKNTALRITGSTLYRIFLNGKFIGHGPARGPHAYYRVDEWDLSNEAFADENILAIEVAGYNSNSYYLLDQPSFLQAELISNGEILASTAGTGKAFEATILKHRLQKVQRFSFQRPFTEYYRLNSDSDDWRYKIKVPFPSVECSVAGDKKLLPRRIHYPDFAIRRPKMVLSKGKIIRNVNVPNLWKDRSLVNIGPKLKGFPESELDVVVSTELQKIKNGPFTEINSPYLSDTVFTLPENSFNIVDLGINQTGFIGSEVECDQNSRLVVVFDEILSGHDVNFKRLGCVDAVVYELQPGRYQLESFEPYTFRYLKLIVLKGSCRVKNIYLREYANSQTSHAQFSCDDVRLNRIFEAARQTFRQNAVDIFMDCPSRERAGWLCDSFFSARVAMDLCGHSTIEKNFLENFQLPDKFEFLPDGMLPMCYPADHNDGVFIPNWAMWFVVELQEYLTRSGDRELVDALKPKVFALLDYFKPFQNEDGLLEKLSSWVFVEWSKANGFVQDVNYPSNMLYAAVLEAAGNIYNQKNLLDQAAKIRQKINEKSFDGTFFTDNAIRKDGQLQNPGNRTEVCQYYAFFFNIATPSTHPDLWQKLTRDFAPNRDSSKTWPEIFPANAFIGNYLRLELMSRYGLCQQLKNEIVDYFLYMADRTGTLWENVGANASCNHGFASHVAHVLYRDILGVYEINSQQKIVKLRLSDVGLLRCSGNIPTEHGMVSVRWQKKDDNIIYHAQLPKDYQLKIETLGSINAVPAD